MIKKKLYSAFLLLCFTTSHAFASSGGSSHDEGGSGGLPQLDPASYPSQIFWLIITFVLMFVFFSRKSLPEISSTIENRSERIKNDLDSAERLKQEVEGVQASYEESLSSAREQSQYMYKDIEDDIKKKAEKYEATFKASSDKKVASLEKNIVKARKQAIKEMSDVAAQVAADAAEMIIGVRTDDKNAKDIVNTISKVA